MFADNRAATVGCVDYEIVEIGPGEIGSLRELLRGLHAHEVAVQPALGHTPARSDEDYWQRYSSRFADWYRNGDGYCFAARETGGGEYLGFVFGIEKESDSAYDTGGERLGYIEEIAVLDAARGAGVGRALMDAARARLRERGITSFKLSTVPGNDAAREFYAKLGLKPAARLLIGEV